ncbi:MAG: hypothetical protein AAFN70_11470, partial [Planctomycetota bacterium]
ATAMGNASGLQHCLEADNNAAVHRHRTDFPSEGYCMVRATAMGRRDLVELLVNHGASLDAVYKPQSGNPAERGMPLIAAVYAGHLALANWLLDRGATPHAHPNCAAPLVDMLLRASIQRHDGWLALSELRYVTVDPLHHLQPFLHPPAAYKDLLDRCIAAGATPQIYTQIAVGNDAAIDALLDEPTQHVVQNGHGTDVFSQIILDASWMGYDDVLLRCYDSHLDLMNADLANRAINAALRSHNRDGSAPQYHRLIAHLLRWLRDHDSAITCDPFRILAEDFLETYHYGHAPSTPSIDELLGLARLFLEFNAPMNDRQRDMDFDDSRPPLAAAIDHGIVQLAEFLIDNGVGVSRHDPPHSNPIDLARRHGFDGLLQTMRADDSVWNSKSRWDHTQFIPVTGPVPSATSVRFDQCDIRSGTIDIPVPSGVGRDDNAARMTRFIPFDLPYDESHLPDVRVLVSNANLPTWVCYATVGTLQNRQGILLQLAAAVPKSELAQSYVEDANTDDAFDDASTSLLTVQCRNTDFGF